MDSLNDMEILSAAWRALAGNADCEGWRTIPITVGTTCHVLAGRHFPGNQEAVLVGFRQARIPAIEHLPEGNGFAVKVFDSALESGNRVWFALIRQIAGNLEMFTMMASDVVATLNTSDTEDDNRLFDLFLGRIRAWQGFMQHGRDGVLSPQAEVGLHGELVLLGALLQSGIAANMAIGAWYGPLDGIQDFKMATGAIEVKTTISSGSFIATVASLEQLDDSLVKPLFLAGVRLRLNETGLNLPDRVAWIRGLLQSDHAALTVFETRLLHAGYFSSMSEHYPRRFIHDKTGIIQIDAGFPKLTHANVPAGIGNVRYEIDLELVHTVDVSLNITLQSLGVL